MGCSSYRERGSEDRLVCLCKLGGLADAGRAIALPAEEQRRHEEMRGSIDPNLCPNYVVRDLHKSSSPLLVLCTACPPLRILSLSKATRFSSSHAYL
ncbi:unnamed protein product [Nezara viridula]|uniref:Uncharacterized protein n=1 Tax=Nezara viridula TaxID=85310 RepID=A0A9P0E4H3_NEZVI|nr:unnamed protein product [Nezara viridula]